MFCHVFMRCVSLKCHVCRRGSRLRASFRRPFIARRCGAAAGTRHEMSCSVMRCHVSPPLRPSPPALPKRRPSASCISFLLPLPFRSRRRRLACGASLFRAYRMCAPARVCAGAVRAPDCAREPAQGARLPSVPLGFFRAGARRETKRPPDAASSCPILPRFYRGQALIGNYFIIRERIAIAAPPLRSPPGAALSSRSLPRTPIRGPAPAVSAWRKGRKMVPGARPG